MMILYKGKTRPIGSISPSGKSKKIAPGKWVEITPRTKLPKRLTDGVKIPPAWTNVQYAKDPNARIMAKGTDSKGRIQYLYNPKHVTAQSKEKFARINALNKAYDSLIAENKSNMRKGLPEADCLGLIIDTGIRPGSEKETSASVDAFGATTLEGHHVIVSSGSVSLDFVGKKGVPLQIPVNSADVSKMMVRRKKIAGATGKIFGITGDKLLKYTKRLGNSAGFQSKDFRTHVGTETAMKAMSKMRTPTTMADYKKSVATVADAVADKLGNTRRVALGSYINPAIFEKWRRKIDAS